MRRTVWRFLAMLGLLSSLCACAGSPKQVDFQIPEYQRLVDQANRLAAQAELEAEQGNTDRAIELYREAISTSRDLAQAWINLGVLLLEKGDFKSAADAWTVASELWPSDPRPVYNIGYAWLERFYPNDALTHFERALERDPNYLPALRGAIRAAEWLNIADEKLAERIRRAIFLEKEREWLEYLQRQRSRVEARLRHYDGSRNS